MKSLSKIKLIVIFLLTGTTLCAQDVQRFLGTYSLEGKCTHSLFVRDTFTVYSDIVITEGIVSDLLIFYLPERMGRVIDSVSAFVSNDSLFIPEYYWQDTRYLEGKGKIRNDSIYLSFMMIQVLRIRLLDVTARVKIKTPQMLLTFNSNLSKIKYTII